MALVDSDGTPLYAKITEKVRQKGRVVWDGYYYTRIIEVIFPDRTKATPTALNVTAATRSPADIAAGIGCDLPDLWTPFPGDGFSVCTTVEPAQPNPKTKLLWEVTCQYSPAMPWEHAAPLDRWPKVDFKYQQFKEVLIVDQNGKPIQNSARKPFDPPAEEEYSYLGIEIRRNLATFNPLSAWDFKNSVNSGAITVGGISIPAGAGLMAEYTGGTATWRGTNYYEVRNEILISDRPWLWKKRLLDIGFYQLNASGLPVRIKDAEGRNIVEPQKLDGQGHALQDQQGQPPAWLDFVAKKQRNWAAIGLPATVFPTTGWGFG
jgi:hypothetical protein